MSLNHFASLIKYYIKTETELKELIKYNNWIVDIFSSIDWFTNSPIVALALLVGALKYSEEVIPIEVFQEISVDWTIPKFGNEKEGHNKLKQLAYSLLVKEGDLNPIYEDFGDVDSSKLNITVECGHTNGWKLSDCLIKEKSSLEEYWLLTYPQSDGSLHLFKFVKTEKTYLFAKTKEKILMEDIEEFTLKKVGKI